MNAEYETLIFLHIPKTAGSTFHSILNSKYKTYQIRNVFGSRYSEPLIKQFIEEPVGKKKSICLLKGHMPFGLHNHLGQSSKYITVLRDPVERVISQYYYIKKNPRNPLYDQVEGGGMSISEFVSSGVSVGMNNGQLRFLNGDLDEYDFNKCNEDMLKNVLTNIEKDFLWIGITERFDESILALSKLLGWEWPHYIRENVSNSRKPKRDILTEDIATIQKYNGLDIKLYDIVNEMLNVQVAQIDGFYEELECFKKANSNLQRKWGWLPNRLKRYVL